MKRKPTYAQALALQKAQDAARKSRREAARTQTPEQTPEQKAKWDEEKAEALRRYREKKAQAK